MIKEVRISGYKGFDNFEINKLSRITLFGGKNNVGKTSLIESLFLFHDRLNPQMILRIFAWRGVVNISLDPESMWAPIFSQYNLENSIKIEVKSENKKEIMDIKFKKIHDTYTIPTEFFDKNNIKINASSEENKDVRYILDITYEELGKNKQNIHLLMGSTGMGLRLVKPNIEHRSAVFLCSRMQIDPMEDAGRFGQLDMLGQQDKIVEFLKIIEPNLKSLSSITSGNTSMIYGDIGMSRKIPISYMGDGVSRLLSIILSIATTRNGVVFIDECENGIHYSTMPNVWKAIHKAAVEYNCQILGTTHSYECLESAVEGIGDNCLNDFSYIRLDKIENKIIPKSFNGDNVKFAIKSNMEIR